MALGIGVRASLRVTRAHLLAVLIGKIADALSDPVLPSREL
jgi:hypothetical protein